MRRLYATLAVVLGLSSAACSLLLGGEAEPLPCSQEGQRGPPACDEGFSCQAGLCQPESSAGGGESGAPTSSPADALAGAGGAGVAKGDGVGGAG